MIIQKIYSAQLNNMFLSLNNDKDKQPYFGVKLKAPIQKDTVSFQAKTKVLSREAQAMLARQEARALRDARQIAEAKLAPDKTAQTKKNLEGEERKRGVSKSTAKQIHEEIQEAQQQVHDFIQRVFGCFKVSELSPKNIILDFSDRAKSTISIMEKSATRDWNSKEEVKKNMTDLNAGKIVMNFKTGKPETEEAVSQLIPLIKTGHVTLREIELQRPGSIKPNNVKNFYKKDQEEFDYVSKKFLDRLEDAQEEVLNGLETNVDKIKLIDRPLPKYTDGNYCALHLLLQLNEKGSRIFELQIMGPRVAMIKPLDDKNLKFFKGKEIDPSIYGKLINLWKRLLSDENQEAKEEFLRYFREACLQVREDEIREYETQRIINRPTGPFKTVGEYNLTPDFDLNKQYKIMLDCESNATAAAQKANEAPAQPQKQIKSIEVISKIINKISKKHNKAEGNKIKH